ncbi:R2-like ligand-binding oxidase [Alicyclobacillus sp.]|uniref:R2-like ligand-binding oxidase n=1 Tax=Alicyclobacillus sp. TaxID=61169 RepID=UPI0025C1B1CC|nr:R2-like ligand-binding oxidase [Alicyclobacillus sp.]MCL6517994.1 R2-like ligand-binding oxidase [Alicyclobacillus sp.]
MTTARRFTSTSARGIDTQCLPYRLFQKAKRLGVWDPRDIDFSQDVEDWKSLTEDQRIETLRSLAQFQAGEEAVTLDLLPLIHTIAREGRLEEEMFLTTFLFEEAKHTEFFRLFLDAVGETGDLTAFHTPHYRRIFYEILPEAMQRLLVDPSAPAQARASTVYNMYVEGVLAESGYFIFRNGLGRLGKMPGLLRGVQYIARDESRHIGYGTYLLQRLISQDPSLFDLVRATMDELTRYPLNEDLPPREFNAFGVPVTLLQDYAASRVQNRLEVLARALTRSPDEAIAVTEADLGIEEA